MKSLAVLLAVLALSQSSGVTRFKVPLREALRGPGLGWDSTGESLVAVDLSHSTGSLHWVPITVQGCWQFTVDSIIVNGVLVACYGGCQAILDKGTAMLVGPSSNVLYIQKVIGATQSQFGVFEVNCGSLSSLPSVVFEINGKKYPLPPSAYTSQDDGFCTSNFQSHDSSQQWTLGDVFIRRYYSVFDRANNRVGCDPRFPDTQVCPHLHARVHTEISSQ